MNNLENKEILSDKLIGAIDAIIDKMPNVVFGGSIALNATGLISREIHDIDLFISENDSPTKLGLFKVENMENMFSDTITDVNGKKVERIGLRYGDDVNVCCFKVDNNALQHSKFKFLGREINIQNVNYALAAKKSYASKKNKHIEDLKSIDDILNVISEDSSSDIETETIISEKMIISIMEATKRFEYVDKSDNFLNFWDNTNDNNMVVNVHWTLEKIIYRLVDYYSQIYLLKGEQKIQRAIKNVLGIQD